MKILARDRKYKNFLSIPRFFFLPYAISAICVEKVLETIHSTTLVLFSCLVRIVVVVLCALLSSNVFMCSCCATCALLFLLQMPD